MKQRFQRGYKAQGSEKTASQQEKLWSYELEIFRRVCRAIDTPYSQAALSYVDRSDWEAIANLPFPDLSDERFPDNYLVQSLLRKNPRLPLTGDKRLAAITSFRQGEKACGETNDFFKSFVHGNVAIRPSQMEGLSRARDFIARVLGPVRGAITALPDLVRFGPGATYTCSGSNLTSPKKLKAKYSLTPKLLPYYDSLIPHGVLMNTSGLELARGSRGTTVPKDATTDRFIAIEPTCNIMGQLGIGTVIRRRLRATLGIDLRHQADINRTLARRAQRDGWATIDLRNASNTIAYEVVRWLLPPDWFALLDLFRSPSIQIEDTWVDLEMFSSMGNGYTFELESLIFLALARSYCPEAVSYGDDIVCRQTAALDVIDLFRICGFETNKKKTFLAGVFFESCGVDVFHGRDVRPIFFKDEGTDDIETILIRMANAVRRYAHRRCDEYGCDRRFLPAWNRILRWLPAQIRRDCYTPDELGDLGILRNFDECSPKKRPNGHEGYIAEAYSQDAYQVKEPDEYLAMMAALMEGYHASLANGPVTSDKVVDDRPYSPLDPIVTWFYGAANWTPSANLVRGRKFSVRGRTTKAKFRSVPTASWRNLGPWV